MKGKSLFLGISLMLLVALLSAQERYEIPLADSLYNTDQPENAFRAYETVYINETGNRKLLGVTGMIKSATAEQAFEKADSLVQIADELLKSGSYGQSFINKYLLTKGEFYRKASRFDEAMQVHRSILQIASGVDSLKIHQAEAYFFMGLTFEQLTRFDSSLFYLDQAYSIYQDVLASDDPKFGNIYNSLGVCYHRLNKLDKAKYFYQLAIDYAEKYKGKASSDVAMCLSNLSNIYRNEGDFDKAILLAEEALDLYQKLNDEYGISSVYYSLGVFNFYLGDYGLAKDYLNTCIQIREKIYPPKHYLLIGPYEVLGIAYEASGDYTSTLRYLEKVRPIILSNYGAGSVIEGYNYENTASVFQSLGQVDSAMWYIKIANSILSKNLPPESSEVAGNCFNYASILYDAGNLKEAVRMLERSNQIFETTGMDQSDNFAENLALSGLIAFELGNKEEAGRLFQKAIQQVQLPDGQFKLIPPTLQVLNKYGEYLLKRYQQSRFEADLSSFLAFSEQYLALSRQFRTQTLDPYTKSVLVQDNAIVFKRNMAAFAHLYDQTKDKVYAEKIFALSERLRGNQLRDLQDIRKGRLAGYPDSLFSKEEALKNKISDLEEEILNRGSTDSLMQEVLEEKNKLKKLMEDLKQGHPRLYNLRFEENIMDLEAIQEKISKEQVLVEFIKDDSFYYALSIQKENLEILQLGPIPMIENPVLEWIVLIKEVASQEELQVVSKQLYDLLLAPVIGKTEVKKILIVPIGPLFYVNFEALEDEDGYLIYKYDISYALSLDLHFSHHFQKKDNGVVSIAPGFEDEIKEVFKAGKDSLAGTDQEYLTTVRQPWSLKLAAELSGNKALTGLDANEAVVKETIKRGNVLYFGTHAISDEEDPIRSHLVLAKLPGDKQQDGLLHAYEIFGLPIQAELAVLNACESGLGKVQTGEGMISLAYSLHFAGCPSTVMSLWKVDEKISTSITREYFNFLDKGQSKSEALRSAKLNYLNNAEGSLRHPFYWAGMVLLGQDDPIEIKSWFPPRYWFFLGIAVLSIFWVLFKRRKRPA
jgi:CHAT domain-containing protein